MSQALERIRQARRHTPKVGAECPNWARSVLCGGRSAMSVPTAINRLTRLQRTEEAIVVATRAPRERGCPPWVVLGVKATEAPGVRAA